MMRNIFLLFFFSVAFKSSFSQKDSLLTRVYFAFGKFNLSESATKELEKLIPEFSRFDRIKIAGQTDHFGTNSFNDRLSVNRANEVYHYLITKGFDSSLSHEIIGYGKRNLFVADTASKANENQLNRVVVITLYFKRQNEVTNVTRPKDSLYSTPQKEEPKQIENHQKGFEQQLKEGSSNIILNNLTFEGGRHILLPTAIPVLENILETMKKFPGLEVEIQGHVCCVDPGEPDGMDLDTNEKALSLNRAKAIFDYLSSNGISQNRMTYKGFGSRNRLVYPERTEADASTNRRVEFKITKR
jgi:outer membrane protein OmpA-like peptidoglycan-associated protein